MSVAAVAAPTAAALVAVTFSRFASNLGYRMVFPFLPEIGRGLGVSLVTMGFALSIRDLAGLTAPLSGRIADAHDRRRLLTISAAATGFALIGVGSSSAFALFALALLVANVTKLTHDISMGAWIGDRVPFAQRGRIIGYTETSWALAQLAGIPIVGVIIDVWGWRAGLFAVGALNLVASLALPRTLREATPSSTPKVRAPMRLPRSTWGLLLGNSLLGFGMQIIFVTYGSWLEDDYGLTVAQIGAAAIAFGVAELIGAALTIRLTDRFGKRQSVIAGLIPMVVLLLAVAVVGDTTWQAIVTMAAMVLAFEFTIISAIPLLTELNTEARGTGLGLSIALQTVARAAGSITGAWLYTSGGMPLSAAIAASCTIAALGTFIAFVREPTAPPLRQDLS